jgi:hypothetical protein
MQYADHIPLLHQSPQISPSCDFSARNETLNAARWSLLISELPWTAFESRWNIGLIILFEARWAEALKRRFARAESILVLLTNFHSSFARHIRREHAICSSFYILDFSLNLLLARILFVSVCVFTADIILREAQIGTTKLQSHSL